MKISVYNLGCKVNQYESDSLIRELSIRGFEVTDELEYADYYVLNTCAVTNEAERKSRQAVGRCLNFNPNARIIVCGCASENDKNQFLSKNNVTYVSGVAGKYLIPDILDVDGESEVRELPKEYEDMYSPLSMRTRSYVKVQDGCNNFCSYCLIPYLRGRSRSRRIESVVAECERVASSGEIVLTGINLSAYGLDVASSLTELIGSLGNIDARIRLGSLEVNVIDEEFLSALKGLKHFCPQFHLSLQSGSDSVLKKMNRHYTTDEFYEKVRLIRETFEDAAITTDVICGFPTESEEEFRESLAFAEKVGFADMHVFAYSSRKGTKASRLEQLTNEEKHLRVERMERVKKKSKGNYLVSKIGSFVSVLVEESDGDFSEGYSEEYARVRVQGYIKQGEIIKVYVTGALDNEKLIGEIRA